jgi:hypothetical protein
MSSLVQIYPEVIIHKMNGETFNASDFVQSISIKKSVNQPVSTMSITFNPAREKRLSDNITHTKILSYLKKNIKVQDVISVKMDDRSRKHSFLGFVDSPSENISVFNTSTSYTYSINCSLLLPKLLLRDSIVNSPTLSIDPNVISALGEARARFFSWTRGLTKDGKSPFVGKPEEAVKWILENTPATNTNLGNDISPKTFFDPGKNDFEGNSLLRFKFIDGEYLFSPFLSTYSGPILNYIYSCLDEFFYEVFFDTTTGEDGLAYNTMTIRPKPYSIKNYNKAYDYTGNWLYADDMYKNAIRVNSSMRLQQNLAKSDYELKNFFWLNFTNSLIASASSSLGKFGVQFPIVNLDSIKKYGLRELNATSTLINLNEITSKYNDKIKTDNPETIDNLTSSQDNKVLGYLLDKREKLVEWHAFPFYESGSIVFPYSPNFNLGEYLYYEDYKYYDIDEDKEYDGAYFYMHTIDESFSYGAQPRTILGLSRGAPEGLAANNLNKIRSKFVSRDTFKGSPQATTVGIERTGYDKIDQVYEEINRIEPY